MVLPSLKCLARQPPTPTGVAKAHTLVSTRPGRNQNREVVWFADKGALAAATCNAGGVCGYEAIFNLFPWTAMRNQQHPFAAQLLRSAFAAEHVSETQGDSDYGIDSNDALQLGQKLFAEFLGAHTKFARDDQERAKWIDVAGHADVLVQTLFDPGLWAAAGHEMPSDNDTWQALIASRLEAVQAVVSAVEHAPVSFDIVINKGWHFTVLRMRDLDSNNSTYFEWDEIDAWDLQQQEGRGTNKQGAFNMRKAMTTHGAVQELVWALVNAREPQPITIALRPKIWQKPGLRRWLYQWLKCARVGKVLQSILKS